MARNRASKGLWEAHRGYYVAEDGVGFNSCNPLFIRNKPDSLGRYVGQGCYGRPGVSWRGLGASDLLVVSRSLLISSFYL